MKNFLINQTKRSIQAARSFNKEREQLIETIEHEHSRPPLKPTEDMIVYLDFLMTVAHGGDASALWGNLADEWQNLFSKTLEEMPEPDEDDFLKDLSIRVLESLIYPENDSVAVIEIIDGIEANIPAETPDGIKNYIDYLKKIALGKDTEADKNTLDEKFIKILEQASRDVQQSSIIKDFTDICMKALLAPETGETKKAEIIEEIESRIAEKKNDPEIVSILEYLKSLAQGAEDKELKQKLDPGVLDMVETIKLRIGHED